MKKKTSIHDIARHLKVSSATVSLVLNGKAEENHIRKELVEAILAYVKEVNYRPNLIAKSLRTGKSKILGMLVEGISNPFFSSIASYVENEAYLSGYKLFYSSTENKPEKAKALLRAFRERQVDGYIIAPTPGMEDDIKALIEDRYPVVLFDRRLNSLDTTTVIIDNYRGAYDAAKHLVERGFHNIGLVTLDSEQQQMKDRKAGYADALETSALHPTILSVPYSIHNEENVAAIQNFIAKHDDLDAILFTTNYLALAGLEAIKALGLSVPDDLGIVAFDDNPFFNVVSPTITAIAQPVKDISHEIMSQLKLKLSGETKPMNPETIILKTQLIIRESSSGRKMKRLNAG